jgi:predicted acetyltransferase
MEIRKLQGKERYDAYLLFNYCFHQRVELNDSDIEKYSSATDEDWGAFDDENHLMARIINNHYDFYFDGKAVKAGGIGGVATLPEYRNTGAVREIFNALIPQAYKNGEVISTLYPFNHEFYRKFGYEVVTFQNEYSLTPAALTNYRKVVSADSPFTIRKWNAGDSVSDFLSVYNQFATAYNFAAVRSEEMMLNKLKYDKPFIDRKFSYLILENGKPVSYVIFTDVRNDPAAILQVNECAWTSRESFYAILGFLGQFSADYGTIKLPLPNGIDLLRFIRTPDAYSIEKRVCQHFMVRVMNARKLLEIIKKPANCDFTMKLTDEMIADNNAAFRVLADRVEVLDAEPAGTTASSTTGSKFDIELNVRALGQLASGCLNINEAALRNDVIINSNEEMLKTVFPEKNIFVSESF